MRGHHQQARALGHAGRGEADQRGPGEPEHAAGEQPDEQRGRGQPDQRRAGAAPGFLGGQRARRARAAEEGDADQPHRGRRQRAGQRHQRRHHGAQHLQRGPPMRGAPSTAWNSVQVPANPALGGSAASEAAPTSTQAVVSGMRLDQPAQRASRATPRSCCTAPAASNISALPSPCASASRSAPPSASEASAGRSAPRADSATPSPMAISPLGADRRAGQDVLDVAFQVGAQRAHDGAERARAPERHAPPRRAGAGPHRSNSTRTST